MPFVQETITDTFTVRDENMDPIAGESFSAISLWVNGVTSNVSVTIAESSISTGYYTLSFKPSATGTWYVRFVGSPSGDFDASYFVENANSVSGDIANSVWLNSGTGLLSSISANVWKDSGTASLSSITASVNELLVAEAVWAYSTSGSAVTAGSMGKALSATHQVQIGKWQMTYNTLTLYEPDGSTILKQFTLYDLAGNQSITGVVRRDPV